jgi:cardiolipin synthase
MLRAQVGAPVGGNDFWMTKSGEEYLNRLLEDLDQAQSTIEMEYYWFDADKAGNLVRDAIVRKAREGVQVRILVDNLVTPGSPEFFFERMRKAGADVQYVHDFNKLCLGQSVGSFFGFRDHRKLVIVDGSIAYTGGINFNNQTIYVWKDTQVRIEGPAAAQVRAIFEQAWGHFTGGTAAPAIQAKKAGNAVVQAWSTVSRDTTLTHLYVEKLNEAKDYFYLQSPYFGPPQPVLKALKDAAARGVDVRLLFPTECDWGFMNSLTQDYIPELAAAGIRVFLYDGVYDHSKLFVTDDRLASCGTVNMDGRSFHTNWEDTLLFYDKESVLKVKESYLRVEAECTEMDATYPQAKGLSKAWRKFLRKIYRIL